MAERKEYAIAWDAENAMFGIWEWDDVAGAIGDALDHGDTLEECQARIKELRGEF